MLNASLKSEENFPDETVIKAKQREEAIMTFLSHLKVCQISCFGL